MSAATDDAACARTYCLGSCVAACHGDSLARVFDRQQGCVGASVLDLLVVKSSSHSNCEQHQYVQTIHGLHALRKAYTGPSILGSSDGALHQSCSSVSARPQVWCSTCIRPRQGLQTGVRTA